MRQSLLDLLQHQIKEGLHLGARLYVSRQHETQLDLSVGQASEGVPMTTDTRLLWMSAGKPITAVALLQQVERRLLALNDPVTHYLPEFGIKGKDPILIQHLLTHTGGFRLADKIELLDWAQAIREICAVPLEPNWEIGKKAGYHISGSWLILAELIQRTDPKKRNIATYLKEEVYTPCGMKDTALGLTTSPTNLSTMHLSELGTCTPHPLHSDPARLFQWRTGSHLIGPAQELGRFYEALLTQDGSLLQPETIKLMTQRHRQGVYDQTFRHIIDFGLGVAINSSQYAESNVPYGYGRLASSNTFGHGGNQSSIAFADPKHQLVFVYITNGMPGEAAHQKRMRDVMNLVYEELGLSGN
ncbi:MAG: serine hydrolase domain-containing protein [Blastochloris sp.]|nr:serine hydrolase domain-containing protein [Blastochloris sp.]